MQGSKNSSGNLIKILPYVNNEHISNAYKSPSYLKPSPSNKNNIKYNDKGIIYKNNNYNKIEKKSSNIESLGKLPVIPNRKLSPIRKQIKV